VHGSLGSWCMTRGRVVRSNLGSSAVCLSATPHRVAVASSRGAVNAGVSPRIYFDSVQPGHVGLETPLRCVHETLFSFSPAAPSGLSLAGGGRRPSPCPPPRSSRTSSDANAFMED
jgi:hypothetical protein